MVLANQACQQWQVRVATFLERVTAQPWDSVTYSSFSSGRSVQEWPGPLLACSHTERPVRCLRRKQSQSGAFSGRRQSRQDLHTRLAALKSCELSMCWKHNDKSAGSDSTELSCLVTRVPVESSTLWSDMLLDSSFQCVLSVSSVPGHDRASPSVVRSVLVVVQLLLLEK